VILILLIIGICYLAWGRGSVWDSIGWMTILLEKETLVAFTNNLKLNFELIKVRTESNCAF
jgi:hypothetical protein